MHDRFNEITKRLETAGLERPVEGSSRRSFITKVARTAAALGAGLIGASPDSTLAAPRRCTPPKTRYRIAEEDGIITDALGTRFVQKGDNIVLDNPVGPACTEGDGDVSIENTAGQCGISYYYPGISYTYLAPAWSELLCRDCPWQGSNVRASHMRPKLASSFAGDRRTAMGAASGIGPPVRSGAGCGPVAP